MQIWHVDVHIIIDMQKRNYFNPDLDAVIDWWKRSVVVNLNKSIKVKTKQNKLLCDPLKTIYIDKKIKQIKNKKH